MTKAFVETTILVNFLLKRDSCYFSAQDIISRFRTKVVPHYAWKEFRRGALQNYVYAHNKLKSTRSMSDTLTAISEIHRMKYKQQTAIQAVFTAMLPQKSSTLGILVQKYGADADPDVVNADECRLELKRLVTSAWKQQATLFGGSFHMLRCLPLGDLTEDKNGMLMIKDRDCPKDISCSLRLLLNDRSDDLMKMRDALDETDNRKETAERKTILRKLAVHKSAIMDQADCEKFGDAYFVTFCPEDATIITTNTKDIKPLAEAVGVAWLAP